MGMAGMGQQLNLVVSVVFSNLNSLLSCNHQGLEHLVVPWEDKCQLF